ncbi:DUF674 family protein [Trifolium pratense]|uniref:DUF674 family protein n=1 Tax=Trifolium pratense TaxID=57577 RepID=A0A2K3LR57_TRIPR|nr:DUF674 family protein [Trifolium pratense]
MTELSPENYLVSQDLKNKLTKLSVVAQFGLDNQIIPIETASLPVYYFHTYRCPYSHFRALTTIATTPKDGFSYDRDDEMRVLLDFVDPKFSASKSSNRGEFVKGPSTYMVTDDLVVTPMSPFNAISHLNSSNVSLSDVDEKVVTIGSQHPKSLVEPNVIVCCFDNWTQPIPNNH